MREKGKVNFLLLAVVFIIVAAAITILAYQKLQIKKAGSNIDSTSETKSETQPDNNLADYTGVKTSTPIPSWKTYVNQSAKYSLQYPSDWTVTNIGLMDTEPADEYAEYVRFSSPSDSRGSVIGFDLRKSSELDISDEIELDDERDLGRRKAVCGTTADGINTFCWLKASNGYDYLIFTLTNYQNSEDNDFVEQVISTLKYFE